MKRRSATNRRAPTDLFKASHIKDEARLKKKSRAFLNIFEGVYNQTGASSPFLPDCAGFCAVGPLNRFAQKWRNLFAAKYQCLPEQVTCIEKSSSHFALDHVLA
ncbi:hypothetical protein Taro_034033 [Colocasia esculenta]|uniref:Uncharacterized protein n=1 Tax=Colocasia esculenta TaxID=4460 RepID=A0A843VWR3_COLES|nr:hypothetical protein [Colocasia esculenta]